MILGKNPAVLNSNTTLIDLRGLQRNSILHSEARPSAQICQACERGKMPCMKSLFHSFAHRVAEAVGSAWAFFFALLVVIIWAITGPAFGYSDTWQLVINTGTTIITFLMVFLIQHTQNRDSRAVHLKLDELIRSVGSARNRLVNLEECTDEELAPGGRISPTSGTIGQKAAEA